MPKTSQQLTVSRILRHLAAAAISLLFLLPIYWMLVSSLREPGLPPPRSIEWWPPDAQWDNYPTLFEQLPMARYLRNSLLVVAAATPLTLLTASLAGFGLSQLPDQLRRRTINWSVAFLLIPASAVWLFRFQLLRWFGLLDSLWALIIPAFAASSPLFVLLYFWSFRRVPGELIEAARLDGAEAGQVWWRVGLPLVRPTTVAVAVLTFVLYWSDFISPVLYIYQARWYTLPIGLQLIKQLDATNWPLLLAAAAVMTIPIIIVFFLLQRTFLSDLSLGELFDRG